MGVPAVTGCATRRAELGRCLRAYRDLLGPRQVGLPVRGRRLAPGLRREEVAALAGVGVTWYTWLEQGRVTASDHVLDAVGRVFGIDDVGREHLRALSRAADATPAVDGPDALRPLLDSWASDPAVLLDERMDVAGANTAWRDVWGAPGEHVLPLVTAGPPDPGRTGDPGELVLALARRFRMLTDLDPAHLSGLREQVRAAAPEFGRVWDCRGVGAFGRPRIRVDGTDRVGHLVGAAGAQTAAPAVLVLLPT